MRAPVPRVPVDAPSLPQVAISARCISVVVARKEVGDHWPRLLKAPGKAPQWLKIDWDRWKDEDEEEVCRALANASSSLSAGE